MKKKLAKILISLLVVVVVAKIFVSIAAYQMATSIQDEFRDSAAIDFSSFSTGLLSGEITFNNVRFRPFRLKREVQIPELELDYGNSFGFVSSMIGSLLGDYYSFAEIRGYESRMRFPDEPFYTLLATETGIDSRVWVGWLSCDGASLVTSTQLEKMGQEAFVFDWSISRVSGNSWKTSVETTAFGRFELEGEVLGSRARQNADVMFSWLELDHFQMVDNGLFRKQLNACSDSDALNLASFSEFVLQNWVNMLRGESYRVNQETVDALRQYMQTGGVLRMDISANTSERRAPTNDFGWRPIEFLRQISVKINDAAANSIQIEKFTPEPKPEPKPVVKIDRAPDFTLTPLEDLDLELNKRVRVTMDDEKSYEGILTSVSEFQFEIEPLDAHGKISYTLDRRKLVEFEVWK